MRDAVVFGAGGYARSVAEAIILSGDLRVRAFVAPETQPSLLDIPVLNQDQWLSSGQEMCGVIAVGDNLRRSRIADHLLVSRPGFSFLQVIHPAACVSPSADIGTGSVLLAGSVIGTKARIGSHVAIWSAAVVEHDASIGDFASLAPGAAVGGGVTVGKRSFLGIRAAIIHGVSIGSDAVIAAGAVVVADCPDCVTLMGVPARVISSRRPHDPYL